MKYYDMDGNDDVRKVLYLYPSSRFDNNSRDFCSLRAGEGLSVEEIEKIKKIADVVVVNMIDEKDYYFATMNSIINLARAGMTVIVQDISKE